MGRIIIALTGDREERNVGFEFLLLHPAKLLFPLGEKQLITHLERNVQV